LGNNKVKEKFYMRSELHLSNADLKYWVDEFPILEEIKTEIKGVKNLMKENLHKKYFCKQVALEVYLHKNASNYALLGLEYIPDTSESLDIEVQYINENEVRYESELSKFNSYRYLGLPEEYVDLVIQEIRDNTNICGGTVKVPIAVNCEVGSSPFIFSNITKILLEILCNTNEDINLELFIKESYKKYFLNK